MPWGGHGMNCNFYIYHLNPIKKFVEKIPQWGKSPAADSQH
jgi:hypothetical protein